MSPAISARAETFIASMRRKHPAGDEQRAERGEPREQHQRQRERAHHHRADARAVAEIVADQQAEAVGQRVDAGERAPLGDAVEASDSASRRSPTSALRSGGNWLMLPTSGSPSELVRR